MKLEKQSEIFLVMGLSSLFSLFDLAATVHLDVSASPFTLMPNSNARLLSDVSIRRQEHGCTDFTFMWSLIRAEDCSNAILYLPRSQVIGTFHPTGSDENPLRYLLRLMWYNHPLR